MRTVFAFLRNAAAFFIGVFTAILIIALGRELALGDGLGVSRLDANVWEQTAVAVAWFIGAAVGTWLALQVAKRPAVGLVACAWLFQMALMSPGIRPAELGMRFI